jgi:Arc/MetJ-type ribon-helix-helix transcriptional regulator
MAIDLRPEHQKALETFVAQGRYRSVSEAHDQLLNAALTADYLDSAGDLSWLKPLIDEAEASIARGDLCSLDDITADGQKILAPQPR